MKRTLIESLKHVRDQARADKLGAMGRGGCVYEDRDTGRHCGIGCLMPRDLLDRIHAADVNLLPLTVLVFEDLGIADFLRDNGLTKLEAKAVQQAHDKEALADKDDGGNRVATTFPDELDGVIAELERQGSTHYRDTFFSTTCA